MFESPTFEWEERVYTNYSLVEDFASALRGNPDVWWRVPDGLELCKWGWRRYDILGRYDTYLGDVFGGVVVATSTSFDGVEYVRYLGELKALEQELETYKQAKELNEPYEFELMVEVGDGTKTGIHWQHTPKPVVEEPEPVGGAPEVRKRRRWWQR